MVPPGPAVFSDSGGRRMVRFRTLVSCLGLLRGVCSKRQRPFSLHSQVILHAHTNTSSLSLAQFCSFSPPCSFSTSTSITCVFTDSFCRHLNQMCLPVSSSFTYQTFPMTSPSLSMLCSPSQFPTELSFDLESFFTLVSGALALPKP